MCIIFVFSYNFVLQFLRLSGQISSTFLIIFLVFRQILQLLTRITSTCFCIKLINFNLITAINAPYERWERRGE